MGSGALQRTMLVDWEGRRGFQRTAPRTVVSTPSGDGLLCVRGRAPSRRRRLRATGRGSALGAGFSMDFPALVVSDVLEISIRAFPFDSCSTLRA